jgi:aspartate/methionine/tyrosine aminotransferase
VEKYWSAKTAAVLIASPSNPTGTLIDHGELQRIHAVVKAHGGVLIVDEIYHGPHLRPARSHALEFADDIFIINSFSKYFGMTGWRLGWMVAPEQYVAPLDKLAQNLFISPSDLAQQAALAAFDPQTVALLEKRRDAFALARFLLPNCASGFAIRLRRGRVRISYCPLRGLTSDVRFLVGFLEKAVCCLAPVSDF